ncbi:MAG: hypothetical protein KJO43_10865, partial [Phycisphaerae bacterium]|nr:hypothetical protein [Phycisphaerae bacterium]
MRCTGCNYPLWNLKARACPECGLAFCPSEHEFLPNSVRFCCPHCDQSYYGTDGRGHLVPSAFACVSCGRDVEMDAMVLRPAEGVAEAQTRVDDHPWLERANRGVMRGWFATIGRAMVAPGRLMRATPAEGSLGSAWWFIIATSIIVFGLGIGIPFFVIGLIAAFASGDWMEPVLIGASFVGGGVVFTLLMVAVW